MADVRDARLQPGGAVWARRTLAFAELETRGELLCLARGARRISPDVCTVIDVGGQDAKVLQLDASGKIAAFQVNDRCAAGAGQFFRRIADALDLGLEEMSELAEGPRCRRRSGRHVPSLRPRSCVSG